MTTLCAWCLAERGEAPNENDSHGICEEHAAQIRAEAAERREQKAREKEKVAA